MTPIIELQNLTMNFGKHQVLKGLTRTLKGRCIGLLGPNGAGKTTLIHTLLGFYKPTAGSARIFDRDIQKDAKSIRSLIGYMPERDSFIAGMSCVKFVRMMAELSGLPASAALERAHEALFFVGLGEARYRDVDTYSLGMKQLAKLAQAIVHGPKLIILDEPTNGLDPPTRTRMLQLIRDIRDSGEAHIVLSSHLLRDVEECCEEIVIMKKGEIVVHCDLAEERKSNHQFLELETRGDRAPFVAALEHMGCEYALTNDRKMKLILPEGIEVDELYRYAEAQQLQIRRLNYKRDSLEDIFLKAMEK